MSFKIPSTILLLTAALATGAPPETGLAAKAKMKVSPRLTHAALKKQQAATLPVGDVRKVGLKEIRPEPQGSKAAIKTAKSLIDRSTILCSGGHWTIVPKDSVLHVPKFLKMRVDGKRAGRLLPWRKFLARNRNWILEQPVNLSQASGEEPLHEKALQVHRNVGRLVIATCQGGPISVKAPPAEEATLASATASLK